MRFREPDYPLKHASKLLLQQYSAVVDVLIRENVRIPSPIDHLINDDEMKNNISLSSSPELSDSFHVLRMSPPGAKMDCGLRMWLQYCTVIKNINRTAFGRFRSTGLHTYAHNGFWKDEISHSHFACCF